MAWTTPYTWAPNDIVSAADLNTNLRDNLNYLLYRSTVSLRWTGGDISTSSTTVVPIDSTNIVSLITTVSGRLFYQFTGSFQRSSGTSFNPVNLGMRIDGTDYPLAGQSLSANPVEYTSITVQGVISGLGTGTHTFIPTWYTPLGGTVLVKGSSTYPFIFNVWEA